MQLALTQCRDSSSGRAPNGGGSSPGTPIPSGWSSSDIGSVGQAGSAPGSGGAFTVAGSGWDIWGGSDVFQFLYETLTGDLRITARVRKAFASLSFK